VNPRLAQVTARLRALVAGFTPGQRGVVIVAGLGLILGAVALTQWMAQPTWTPLFSQLSGTDANAIVEQLRADNVQYQLVDGGTTVLVPQAQVYDLRVSLAGKGLPGNDAGSGWSIVDKQGMTATDFQQNIAFQRALEGELSKTLGAMTGVKTAIVHLAIPKKDVFATAQDKTTASVLLQLAPGTSLTRAQIRSVTHLVAGSVPSLDPSDVTLTDANGNLLSTREDGTSGAVSAANDADQQTALFEDRQSMKLQQMLDQALGPGHAIVRVNAQLDFSAKDSTSELYVSSPSPLTLSEATNLEQYNGAGSAAGGPLGVPSPSLSPVAGSAGAGAYLKQGRTANFGVGKVVTNEKAAPGSVQRLTVSVVLDAKTAGPADPTKVQAVQAMATQALGIDAKRGDLVTVTSLPFDTTTAAAAQKELAAQQSAAQLGQYLDLGKKAGLVLAAIVVGLILLRRSKNNAPTVKATASDVSEGVLVPSRMDAIGSDSVTAIEGAAEQASPVLERERLRDEVAEFVDSQPDDIAQLVQGWLGQKSS
jgi:flagellar M-ring protein FliF